MDAGAEALHYGESKGYKPLRECIADNMRMHGMNVHSEEILLTNGAQNAIDLVSRLLTKPGCPIIFEKPSYSSVIPLFRYHSEELLDIPVNEDGMNLDILPGELEKVNPSFIYTVPNFHNPTGITTSQSHREKLIGLCETYQVPLVEDGFVEEMKYFGKAVLPIKSMDKRHIVFYLGTFSKILFPGLRLCWICADKYCIDKLALLKRLFDISGNHLTQIDLNMFCRSGGYETYLKRFHRIYRKRIQTAMKAARIFLPESVCSYTKPFGGYVFWVTLNDRHISEDIVRQKLMKAGISVAYGSTFFTGKPEKASFRVSIAHCDETEIWEGMKKTGEAMNAM
jgi:DNA-binding transcriptional MocR family regulator